MFDWVLNTSLRKKKKYIQFAEFVRGKKFLSRQVENLSYY